MLYFVYHHIWFDIKQMILNQHEQTKHIVRKKIGGGTEVYEHARARSEAVVVKPKRKWSPRKKFFVGAIAVVAVVIILAIIGGTGGSDGVELIEAKNIQRVSTSITLEEFIDAYNASLSQYLGGDDSLFNLNCINFNEPYKVTPYDELGMTEYTYVPLVSPMTDISDHVCIAVDNETGYVVLAVQRYLQSGYSTASSSTQDIVNFKVFSIYAGLAGGDTDLMSSLIETLSSVTQGTPNGWKDGIMYMNMIQDDLVTVGFSTMTKEYYNAQMADAS